MAEEQPLTLIAQKILNAMDEQHVSIRDLAEKTDSTYEHIRKIIRGGAFPSKYMLRVLCDVLSLNMAEMGKLIVADQIRHKYGKIPLELSGKKPSLEPVERVWDNLTPEQQMDFVAQVQAIARRNRKTATA